MSIINEMLSYPFLVRALVGGLMVSLCASLLGVTLVLKRYSMIGDGLSHVSFGALSIALAMGWSPLKVSIPVVVIAAFFLLRITENSRIKSDAAIAMISAGALAIGIIVTSMTTGMTTDVSSYMFGSILAMSREDVRLSVILSVVVLTMFALCYNKIFAVTFDENFAKATGVNVGAYNVLIAVLTAVTIVLGMRMMGAMLISSLIIFPCLTSMRVFKSFSGVVISSGILSVICFLIGMVASYQFSTPAGASVVIVNLMAFLLFAAWQSLGRRKG
jgi:zinc transport system permease protein